jgi:hypothetical protein
MSTFEFVSVLLSIVISLALAHLLTGVAQALKAKKVRFDWVLAGWWLFVGMLCVDYWFSVWRLRDTQTWSLAFVLMWLLLAATTYIAAWLVVPDANADGTMDFVAHNSSNRRKYLGALIAWVAGGTVVNGYTPSLELANLLVPTFIAVFGAAIIWQHRVVQIVALLTTYAAFLYYAWTFIPDL